MSIRFCFDARLGFVLAVLAGTVGLAGCSSAKREGPPRVALIMKSLANEFFKTMEDGARAHQGAHANDYTLLCNGIKDELDVNRQIELVRQMMAQSVNAIVIAPADSKALAPVCKEALDRGIVVVNIDNKFDDGVLADLGLRLPFVGPDNREGARKAGDYLAQQLPPGARVAIVEGKAGAFNAQQRGLGFADAMEAGGMTVVARQHADWEADLATKLVSNLVIQHPDLAAVLCANDSMALGAVAALGERAGPVRVVGFDNISAVQALIREGKVLCTIDQHADRIAVHGIEYALEILRTGTTPGDRKTAVDLITAESLGTP